MDFIVPKVLRAPIDSNVGEETIWPMVGMSLMQSGMELGQAIAFISGAKIHQNRLVHDEENEQFLIFPGIVRKIEIVERFGGDDRSFLVGKKARIHIEVTKGVREGEMDVIDTEWIEYNGSGKEEYAFFIALSQNIMHTAEELMNKEVFCRKTFLNGKTKHSANGKIRYISDIWPDGRAESSSNKSGERKTRSTESSNRRSHKSDTLTIKDLEVLIDESAKAAALADELSDAEYDKLVDLVLDSAKDKDYTLPEDAVSDTKVEDEFYDQIDSKEYLAAFVTLAQDSLSN